MSDYSEHGTIPVEDAAVDDPPTVDEVDERQRRDFPEQARTSTLHAADQHATGDAQARENAELDPPA